MAALRHAARRLCDRALQGAPRIPPGRRPMSVTSNTNGKRSPIGEKLHQDSEKRRREFEDMIRNCYRDRNCTDTNLPKSGARGYGKFASISAVGTFPFFLGYVYYRDHFSEPKKEEDGATSTSSDAKIIPDGVQNNDPN